MSTRLGRYALALLSWAFPVGVEADGQVRPAPTPIRPRVETIAFPESRESTGRLVGDAQSGFRFRPDDGTPALPLAPGAIVTFDGPPVDATSGTPPMRVMLGLDQQISGRLGTVDSDSVTLEGGPGGLTVTVARGGAVGLDQRHGETLVLRDGFEALDAARWSEIGLPICAADPHMEGERSLRLPAGGSAITCRLAEPIVSGRLEVAFHDEGKIVAGQQWFVDLLFRGGSGNETVRAVLDLGEESLAVLSLGGHALPVQRLPRRPGWHRLAVRFGPEVTDLAVDAFELAHGRGPGGPLIEIRLANHSSGNTAPPEDLAIHFDDLRLVRLAEPVGGLEVDPTQDTVRLADGGDQIFGRLKSADADTILMAIEGRDVALSWTEVAGIDFRRAPTQGRPIEGLLVRVEWRPSPGNDPRDVDRVEGALVALSDDSLTLGTPYAGKLTIPRERLRMLRVLGRGRRIVLDPTGHHLGNEISPSIDPPLPEGGILDRPFRLDSVPDGTAWLVMDVVSVVGEANSDRFSPLVRNGEIRTHVRINGQRFDYLNRHITTRNETPDRIRLPIPASLLRAGENRLRIEQDGQKDKPEELDDLGILSISLEFDAGPTSPEKP